MQSNSVFITSACRSPIGVLNGQFSDLNINDLSAPVIRETIKRSGLSELQINEVIIGNVLCAGKGQNPARQVALRSGIPEGAPATTINMLCGSGLNILTGQRQVILCGGMESMSRAEHSALVRQGVKTGDLTFKDTLLVDGLTDAMHNCHMGVTAENVANKYSISRPDQDKYAQMSQERAGEAISLGYYKKEIVPVKVNFSKTETRLVESDEAPRPTLTLEKLSTLSPIFDKTSGSVTAGNASGINDGSAFVVIAHSSIIKSHNLKPLARIVGYDEVGMNPLLMGLGPVPAIESLLKKIDWSKEDVDLYEINEAFAAQALGCLRALNLDVTKVNVSGGAIALGHPIGASGTRVLVTLIYNLQRLGKKRGIASLCVGGGIGVAMAIELCDSSDL